MSYSFQGNHVFIPRHAEVTTDFHGLNSRYGQYVQEMLDEIEPWETGNDPIETVWDMPFELGARTVELASHESRLWGVNPYHKARNPGLSPFYGLSASDERSTTTALTIELGGSVEKPILTRIYPGEYMPPLPWMKSAPKADGGKEACLDYWREHAFVIGAVGRVKNPDFAAPEWYTS